MDASLEDPLAFGLRMLRFLGLGNLKSVIFVSGHRQEDHRLTETAGAN